jgi:tetratricopeptide (TPR) repeat protein
MPYLHLTPTSVDRFLDRELPIVQLLQLSRHLATCDPCRGLLMASPRGARFLLQLDGLLAQGRVSRQPSEVRLDLGGILGRVRQQSGAPENWRHRASAALQELPGLSATAQIARVREDTRLHCWFAVEQLLQKSRTLWTSVPTEALALANLALVAVDHAERRSSSPLYLRDLRALCWAYIGNSWRVVGDFREAAPAFQQAQALLQKGTGDPLTQAEVYSLEASLRREMRNFETAVQLLHRAVRIYRRANEPHLLGRTLIKKAATFNDAGEPEQSLVPLQEARGFLKAEKEPRLMYLLQHELVRALLGAGHVRRALGELPELRRLSGLGNHLDGVRIDWVEAQILIEAGSHDPRAEGLLLQARQNLLDADLGYDAALVSLDLAALYLREGRVQQTRILAQEMVSIFQSRDIEREALAALLVFTKAAELETTTAGMVADIARYLERARGNPALCFEPPS